MESALTRPNYLGSEVITSRVSTSVGDSLRSLDAVLFSPEFFIYILFSTTLHNQFLFTTLPFIQQTLQSVSNFTIYALPLSSNTTQQGKSP